MTAHDRKALLRGFYGLVVLWLLNGVFGLMRAAGPGALLPYIEIGLLFSYWAMVFNWWRKNRPRPKSQPAKKVRSSATAALSSEEIRDAVDREEAIARERNRRRKQKLEKMAGGIGAEMASLFVRFRYAIIACAILILVLAGYQGYLAISESLARQAAVTARAEAAATAKAQTLSAMIVWDSRNRCLKTELNLRWQDWYVANPDTQTHEYFSFVALKRVTQTRTLPLPNSLSDVPWVTFGPDLGKKKTIWQVSQSHFEPLVASLRQECLTLWPPPDGLTEEDLALDYGDFVPTEVPYEEQWRYRWLNPFPDGPLSSYP